MTPAVVIVPLAPEHQAWAYRVIEEHWGSTEIMSRWRWHNTRELPAFVALHDQQPVGIATYTCVDGACELVTLNSFLEDRGVGEALLYAVRDAAKAQGCTRLWLTTSNDNLRALGFYQKRGMAIVAVHRFAVDAARKVKPAIPVIGQHGIPCRDELELEMDL